MGNANITICHPNKDGDGSALRIQFVYQTDEMPGYMKFSFANQTNDGKFAFDDALVCKLKFDETAQILQFLSGETDAVGGDGEPLELNDGLLFAAKHIPETGYALGVIERNGTNERKAQIVLKPYEATGLRETIASSLFFLAFIKGVNP